MLPRTVGSHHTTDQIPESLHKPEGLLLLSETDQIPESLHKPEGLLLLPETDQIPQSLHKPEGLLPSPGVPDSLRRLLRTLRRHRAMRGACCTIPVTPTEVYSPL